MSMGRPKKKIAGIPPISAGEEALRRLELQGIDGDIVVAAADAGIGYDVERMQRVQVLRCLRELAGGKTKGHTHE